MQLSLFPWESLSPDEVAQIVAEIRGEYWFIRNGRGNYQSAAMRKRYRRVQGQKKRLLLAGVPKGEILKLLSCFRSGCKHSQCLHCAAV